MEEKVDRREDGEEQAKCLISSCEEHCGENKKVEIPRLKYADASFICQMELQHRRYFWFLAKVCKSALSRNKYIL